MAIRSPKADDHALELRELPLLGGNVERLYISRSSWWPLAEDSGVLPQ